MSVSAVVCGQWKETAIPAFWKSPPAAELKKSAGYAWFRCGVKIPSSWAGRPMLLFVEPVDDARQTFVNGQRVGGTGTFPPRYRSGLGESGRFRLPAGALRPGEVNIVAVRVYSSGSRTNFSIAPPTFLAGGEGIRLDGQWQYRFGDDPAWASAKAEELPQEKLFSKVDKVKDTAGYLLRRKGDNEPLSPRESLRRFELPDDLRLELVIAEPDIAQPLCFHFDERGRLWVLQYRQYPDPAGLKPLSRDKFLRTVYDKVPAAPPGHVRGRDRITIHEDLDGDGYFEKQKTFLDGLNIATSFARGREGVWVLNPPYLLFYPDSDGDDSPDGDPQVRLEGFGLEDSHSVVNSLCWGPDGWLYAAQGSTVTARVRAPGSKEEPVHTMGQLIWRYHPSQRRYEVFAEGGGNTFGIEIDSGGRIYSGTNWGDSRGFHYVQGGYYRKGFQKHGRLSNLFTFGYFDDMDHNSSSRFTHDLVIYEGVALPGRYRGRLFGVEPVTGQVVLSEVSRDRSSFKTRDVNRPVKTEDQWFRPVNIELGPGGAIYVADFHEQRIDHSSHYAGRVARGTGRIYRLVGKETPPSPPRDFSRLDSAALVSLLANPDRWVRHLASRLLGERRDEATRKALEKELFSGPRPLEALWSLGFGRPLDDRLALRALAHPDEHVRRWAVRLVCDQRQVSGALVDRLVELAIAEKALEVRSQLASSARRLAAVDCLRLVEALSAHDEDSGDVHVPLLLWWAIESKLEANQNDVVALFGKTALWERRLVAEHLASRVMRRFAVMETEAGWAACLGMLRQAPGKKDSKRLVAGFEKAFAGRTLPRLPDALVAALLDAGGASLELRLRAGDGEALEKARAMLVNAGASNSERERIARVLGEIERPAVVGPLLEVLKSGAGDSLRGACLGALGAYEDDRIPPEVLKVLPMMKGDLRDLALELLSSRKAWAGVLVAEVGKGRVAKGQVPRRIIRRLLGYGDSRLSGEVTKTWGKLEVADAAAIRAKVEAVKKTIEAGTGNPYEGERLFMARCGRCHRLFADGGEVGPDLTSYQREDLERMIANIVAPSSEIRTGYENNLLITRDGRTLEGFLADSGSKTVALRTIEGQTVVLPREKILQLRVLETSVMPEDLLREYNEQQLRDLFAYLRSTQPLP